MISLCTLRKALPPFFKQLRSLSTTVPVADLRGGQFVKIRDTLCVVLNVRKIVYGRTPAYLMLEWHPYNEPDNLVRERKGITDKIERIDLDRCDGFFSYIDPIKKVVILNDQEYCEFEVPIDVFPKGAESVLTPGDPVVVYRYDGNWLYCTFNLQTQNKIKQASVQQ